MAPPPASLQQDRRRVGGGEITENKWRQLLAPRIVATDTEPLAPPSLALDFLDACCSAQSKHASSLASEIQPGFLHRPPRTPPNPILPPSAPPGHRGIYQGDAPPVPATAIHGPSPERGELGGGFLVFKSILLKKKPKNKKRRKKQQKTG